MSKPKSEWHLSGCVAMLVVASILGVIFTIALALIVDHRMPVDDGDLRIARPSIPDEENGYVYVVQCAHAVSWPEDDDQQVHEMAREDGEPTPEFVARFLDQNMEAVELSMRALSCAESVYSRSFGELESQHVTGLYAIVQALDLRAKANKDAGDRTAHAMKTVALGQQIKDAKGPVPTWLLGFRLQEFGYDFLGDVLKDFDPIRFDTAALIEELDQYQKDTQSAADALREDYTFLETSMDTDPTFTERAGLFLSLEGTKRYAAEAYRAAIRSAALPYCESQIEDYLFDEDVNIWYELLRPNPIGKIATKTYFMPVPRLLEALAYHRSYNSAVQVLLTLKVYHTRHGELPESLDVLVPEFFDELPRDWFDGGPIKYNRAKALVYCVGPDLEDQGGSDPDAKWTTSEDPSWSIAFATPARSAS